MAYLRGRGRAGNAYERAHERIGRGRAQRTQPPAAGSGAAQQAPPHSRAGALVHAAVVGDVCLLPGHRVGEVDVGLVGGGDVHSLGGVCPVRGRGGHSGHTVGGLSAEQAARERAPGSKGGAWLACWRAVASNRRAPPPAPPPPPPDAAPPPTCGDVHLDHAVLVVQDVKVDLRRTAGRSGTAWGHRLPCRQHAAKGRGSAGSAANRTAAGVHGASKRGAARQLHMPAKPPGCPCSACNAAAGQCLGEHHVLWLRPLTADRHQGALEASGVGGGGCQRPRGPRSRA